MWKYFVPAIVFLIDRILKIICARLSFEGGFIKFGFYKNYAGAFSLPLAGWPYNIAGIILLLIFVYLFILSLRARSGAEGVAIQPISRLRRFARNDSMSYLFIILGGASNLFDRIVYGFTIDYVNFLNLSFFNIADGMLMAGIIILLIENLKIRNSLKIDN